MIQDIRPEYVVAENRSHFHVIRDKDGKCMKRFKKADHFAQHNADELCKNLNDTEYKPTYLGQSVTGVYVKK